MIKLFDSSTSQMLNITDIQINPVAKWVMGAVLSGAISWAGWSTSEVLKAKDLNTDVKNAIERLDSRFNAIDRRLERIETMLMDRNRGR